MDEQRIQVFASRSASERKRWPEFAAGWGSQIAAIFSLLVLCAGTQLNGQTSSGPRHVDLYCHRTANEDVPENTLESLEQAALLGCDVVEIDVRRTADGVLVLNHDGFLERLTDGSGEVETSLYEDLRRRDAGSWMNPRFAGLHIATLRAALSFAKDHNLRLNLDVKTRGLGAQILSALQREGMEDRVSVGGDWDDLGEVRRRIGQADNTVWKQPGITATEVDRFHNQGKAVIVNFSANAYGMDVLSMRSAVAAGADGINVDFPRLGADAVGRPAEVRLSRITELARSGDPVQRTKAIMELSAFRGFDLTGVFALLVADPQPLVSRAAALALVNTRPAVSPAVFGIGLRASSPIARANAAWALGQVGAPCSLLLPLLSDKEPQVLEQTLLALATLPDMIGGDTLLPLLSNADAAVRGAAALALAKHDPKLAASAIAAQLNEDIRVQRVSYDAWAQRGKPQLTPAGIKPITDGYRSQMEEVKALASLHSDHALSSLERQAFRNTEDFSQVNGLVAAFQLWDRVAAAPGPAIEALGSSDTGAADRAEWMLVQAGAAVLPALRAALAGTDPTRRRRVIRILAWQNDVASIEALRQQASRYPEDAPVVEWALVKLEGIALRKAETSPGFTQPSRP